MNLCLGMLAYNDAFLLPKILPILRPSFDRFIVGYTPSTDATLDILSQHSAIIETIPKSYDWADMRNRVIAVAEEEGCTHMMMIDSDECMLEKDFKQLKQNLAFNGMALATMYPRFEFVDDFDHYDPSLFPDFQARGFMLNEGYAYSGRTHEQLTFNGAVCSQNGMCCVSTLPIFHFGKCKPKAQVAFKYLNYDRRQEPKRSLREKNRCDRISNSSRYV
jgi:hypothetical protein